MQAYVVVLASIALLVVGAAAQSQVSGGCNGGVGVNTRGNNDRNRGYDPDYRYTDQRDGNTYINNYYGYGYDYDYSDNSAPVTTTTTTTTTPAPTTRAPTTRAPARQPSRGGNNNGFGVGIRLPLIDPLGVLGSGRGNSNGRANGGLLGGLLNGGAGAGGRSNGGLNIGVGL